MGTAVGQVADRGRSPVGWGRHRSGGSVWARALVVVKGKLFCRSGQVLGEFFGSCKGACVPWLFCGVACGYGGRGKFGGGYQARGGLAVVLLTAVFPVHSYVGSFFFLKL